MVLEALPRTGATRQIERKKLAALYAATHHAAAAQPA